MSLSDLFSSGNEEDAMQALVAAAMTGNEEARQLLMKGWKGQKKWGKKALNAIQDWKLDYYDQGTQQGYGTYLDALGINGPDGSARAQDAFQTGPGYDFALNQGLDALDRRAAGRGMLDSGNTNLDTIKYAQGMANQEYGSWLDRLTNFQGAASGQQSRNQAAQQDVGNYYMGMGDRYGGLYSKLADNKQNMWNQVGGAYADYQNSKDATGANILGAITGGVNLAGKLFGGF